MDRVSLQMAFCPCTKCAYTNNLTGYQVHEFVCNLYEWMLIKTPQKSTRSIKYDDLQSMISFHYYRWSKEMN